MRRNSSSLCDLRGELQEVVIAVSFIGFIFSSYPFRLFLVLLPNFGNSLELDLGGKTRQKYFANSFINRSLIKPSGSHQL